ncbi:MAG: TIGR02266 family protein [Deltaproteobacteria bacterium]|nr:TIGR02266 family protein [Deltaproteobacteria bacterium]
MNGERLDEAGMIDVVSEEHYEDGQVIFEEQSSGDWVYVVESGAVELYRLVDGKIVVIAVAREGEIFGELAFIGGYPRTASARALGNTVVGVIDRKSLDHEYNKMTPTFRLVIKSLAIRLKQTTDACVGKTDCRRELRIPKVLALTFKDKGSFVKAYTHNVSGTGLFIKTPTPLNQGEIFTLDIHLPDDEKPMSVTATVAWSRSQTNDPVARPVGMGVKFTVVSPGDAKRLSDILSKP